MIMCYGVHFPLGGLNIQTHRGALQQVYVTIHPRLTTNGGRSQRFLQRDVRHCGLTSAPFNISARSTYLLGNSTICPRSSDRDGSTSLAAAILMNAVERGVRFQVYGSTETARCDYTRLGADTSRVG